MPHTTREESEDSHHIKKAFVPSRTERWALPLTSFLVLLGLNLLPAIRSQNGANYAIASDFIREWIEKALAPTNNQQASQILTIIFWMVIGAAVYIILWILMSLIANYRRDVLTTRGMILPAGYNKDAAWHETLLRMLVRIMSTLVFLYWIYLLLAGILPYTSVLFLNSVTELTIKSVLQAGAAVLILAGSLFMASIFARCVVLRERVFGS